jgi:hypothetical protein
VKHRTKLPDNLITAALPEQSSGGFAQLAFLPWQFGSEEARPFWADRGKRRKQWDSLFPVQCRVAFHLLGIGDKQHLQPSRPITRDEIKRHERACLRKLGFAQLGDLLEFHRSAWATFQERLQNADVSQI